MTKNLMAFLMLSILFAASSFLRADPFAATSATDSGLLSGYQVVQAAFAQDSFAQAKTASGVLEGDVQAWIDEKGTTDLQYPNVSQIRSGLDAIKIAQTEKELRTAVGLLSQGIVQFIREDSSLQAKWQLFFCPMTSDFGYWVQPKGEKIANPYMGQKMPSCGSKKNWSVETL